VAKTTRSSKPSRSAGAKRDAAKGSNTKKTPAKTTKKPATTKPAAKKPPSKPASKPSPKKAPAKKPAASAKTAKKTTKKPAAKTPAKTASKSAKKPPAPKTAKKPSAKPASKASPKPEPKPPVEPAPVEAPASADQGDAKGGRKGITIVNKKVTKRPTPKKSVTFPAVAGGGLLGPNAPKRKPLIPSGPSVRPSDERSPTASGKPAKSPFKKPELDKFRALLLAKAAELIGDVSGLEEGALRGQSGGLSHIPQHMAEFGSEAYEQTLSLDLAAADRRLLKEIDDALGRIAAGTFGICEKTGKPIGKARLNELPWARYSIEAARDLERRYDPR